MKLYIGRIKNTIDYIEACARDYLSLSENVKISIAKTDNGKPYINGLDINLSVSHSNEYIILAFSKNSIGVDIEKIQSRDYLSLARRYFGEKEVQIIKEKGLAYFYELWTMKEAYSKLKGVNLKTRISREQILEEKYLINTMNILDEYLITIIYTKD